MKRHFPWLLCILLFLLQGTLLIWLLPSSWQVGVHVSPNFVFVIILYIALHLGRHQALVYGLLFGMLQDFIFYGHMLGVHSFAMGLTGYLTGLLQARRPHFILNTMLLVGIGYMVFETIMYGAYRVFNVTKIDYLGALTHSILPSALFNMLFALAVYMPMRKLLEDLASFKKDRDDS